MKSKAVSVYVPMPIYKVLEAEAERFGLSKSEYVVYLLILTIGKAVK